MDKNLVKSVGSIGQDNLIAKLSPAAETFGIKIAKLEAEAVVARGTLLAKNADGTYSAYAGGVSQEKFDGDASTKKFTVVGKPAAIDSVVVGTDAATVTAYDQFSGEVTLAAAPAAGTDNVIVTYHNGSAPSAILADDATVGTSEDETGVAYRCGNFNPDALIVPEGYALTDEDLDTLRKYDIIFTQML